MRIEKLSCFHPIDGYLEEFRTVLKLPLGTLSIDNEMHDDDVRNPRRIG